MPELFEELLIPTEGIAQDRIDGLERELGVPFPAYYRVFLQTVGYLEIFDGYSIWGPQETYVQQDYPGSTHRYLAVGDCWRRADGDRILIDLDSEKTPVVVWCHD